MKTIFSRILALALIVSLCFSIVGCNNKNKDDTIYVGNTAATTGAGASIGVPFNIGIQAAFAAYNAEGYGEIARVLGRDQKSTDNALQRIKAKLRRAL